MQSVLSCGNLPLSWLDWGAAAASVLFLFLLVPEHWKCEHPTVTVVFGFDIETSFNQQMNHSYAFPSDDTASETIRKWLHSPWPTGTLLSLWHFYILFIIFVNFFVVVIYYYYLFTIFPHNLPFLNMWEKLKCVLNVSKRIKQETPILSGGTWRQHRSRVVFLGEQTWRMMESRWSPGSVSSSLNSPFRLVYAHWRC